MQALLKYWPIITTTAAVIGWLGHTVLTLQTERDQLRRQVAEGCQRIETLERVIVELHPVYSASFYYLHAPSCWGR